MSKKAIALVLGIVALVGVFVLITKSGNFGKQDDNSLTPEELRGPNSAAAKQEAAKNMNVPPFKILESQEILGKKVLIKTEKGDIEIELFDEAPIAASNFISLISSKFYDGLTFHRRVEGFVIQGGDPNGTGTGGPGYQFEDEPVMKEYDRGIVAMANSGPDTNGSQFFIMLADNDLPKQYTIFGHVVSGMDVVDQIQIGDKMTSVTIE